MSTKHLTTALVLAVIGVGCGASPPIVTEDPPTPGATSSAEPSRRRTIGELEAPTGGPRRLVKSYVAKGIVRSAKFAGRPTKYDREHLATLVAARVLGERVRLSLEDVKRRVRSSSAEQAALAISG